MPNINERPMRWIRGCAMGALAIASIGLLSGCGLFGSSKPKPTPLTPINERLSVQTDWQSSVGSAGNFSFLPASGGPVVLSASNNGTVTRLDRKSVV